MIRTGLAKRAAEYCLKKTDSVLNYSEFLEKKFLGSSYIKSIRGQRSCGLLIAKLFRQPSSTMEDEPSDDFEDKERTELRYDEQSQPNETCKISKNSYDSGKSGSQVSTSGAEHYVDMHFAHTSESFCICFMSSHDAKPRFILSRMEKDKVGKEALSQGFMIKL